MQATEDRFREDECIRRQVMAGFWLRDDLAFRRIRLAPTRFYAQSWPESGPNRLGLDALDNSELPVDAIAQNRQGSLVVRAVMCSYCLLDVIKFDQYNPLLHAQLVDLRRQTACQKASSS